MSPLHDDDRAHRFPVATAALIAVNVAVFGFALTLPRYGMTLRGFHAKAGAVPFELVHGYDVPPRALVPWWGTPFTSLFVHGGWAHLAVTMLYLWVFGAAVEARLGRGRLLLVYVAGGLASIAAQVVTDTASAAPLIGASGATAGVLGACLVMRPRARAVELGAGSLTVSVPAPILFAVWIGLQALAGALAVWYPSLTAALFAQAAGLAAGAALALVAGPRRNGARPANV